MPILDMPLSQLKTYRGVNERPDDIDPFWDKSIAEMEELGTGCELIPAMEFENALCYDLWFTGMDGARIHAIFVRPRRIDRPVPAAVKFHGYSGNCGNFYDMLPWVSAGMCAVSMDCRGQGGQSEDTGRVRGNTLHGHIIRGLDEEDPAKLYFRNVFLDAAQLARIVMDMEIVDASRVGAYGGSQGGALTLACASLTPGLCRAAAQYPFLSDYRRVWEMDLDKDAYAELQEYFRHFDPCHERESEVFRKLGYIDLHHMTHRIRARVRMYTGLMDTVCPPSTQFAAYNAITAEKDVRIYPDFGHEYLPGQMDDVLKFLSAM